MKTRGIKDFYLPKKIALHIKFLLFCAAFTPIWGLIIKVELSKNFLINTFIIMYIGMEVLYFISQKIFVFKFNPLKKEITRKDITLIYLFRLLLFYVVALAVGSLIIVLFVYISHFIRESELPPFAWIPEILQGTFRGLVIGLLFSSPVFFFVPWQESMKREFELREQNLIFQNETLKNQVNPHFLFNSLNTLSSLVKSEVEIAGQFIGRLSLIYRYILDNGSKLRVTLKDEVEFIRDYFYLHQIRNEGKMNLIIELKDEDYNFEILPVSLQLLIENAIKHNMATPEKPLNISIYTEGQNIVVKNNIQKMATRAVSTKIGLKNLNERVKLITGKEIKVEETASHYLVKVPLLK